MNMYDLITKVKRKQKLTKNEIFDFIRAYTREEIPDYQISALMMAIYFNGLTDEETAYLTEAIADSGERLDLSMFGELTVDKHSTGGVGDKTTLIVAPLAASLGCKVAKMSGRGLGHTGGTVDKLESFPGYRTALSAEEFISQVERHGIAVIGQSEGLAPADKKLYALRDVTATVDSIPLITSSIMGKKLASGTKTVVLDVKYGSGAFMKTPEDAELLARNMVDIGRLCGRNMAALITDMDTPLGFAVGNSLEVIEAHEVLSGRGPSDLRAVSLEIAARLLSLSQGVELEEARTKAKDALDSGKALEKFVEWIVAQGGEEKYARDPALLGVGKEIREVYAPCDGYIFSTDTEKIGLASLALGAGRRTKSDRIDQAAGILLNKKRGDRVERGEPITTLYASDAALLDEGERLLSESYTYSDLKPEIREIIHKVIS